MMNSKEKSNIESVVRAADELNFMTDDENSLAKAQLSLAQHAAGLSLSALQGFSGFNPSQPESASQGALECIHAMQELSCSLTGLTASSLVSLSRYQAAFASLSMIKKHHQRKKHSRSKLLLCADLPEVAGAAGQTDFEVKQISAQQLENSLDETVAAIVLSVPAPDKQELINNSVLARLREMGILIYVDGGGQYFLPASALNDLAADVISLDLGHLSETGEGCYAVLSNAKLKSYLPTPLVQFVDNQYRLQTYLQNPLSIGPLNMGAGNIQAIVRSYTQFRLKGINGIARQALKAVVTSLYMVKKLADSGFEKNVYSAPASGQCCISLNNSASSMRSLQQGLKDYTVLGLQVIDLAVNDKASSVVTVGRLHYLTKKQLDSLVDLFLKYL